MYESIFKLGFSRIFISFYKILSYLPKPVQVEGTEDDVVRDGELVADENCDRVQDRVEVGDRFWELTRAVK